MPASGPGPLHYKLISRLLTSNLASRRRLAIYLLKIREAIASMADKMLWVQGLVVLALIIASPAVDAVSCGDAISALIPCGSFLVGSGAAKPSKECCTSAQSLNKLTTTTADRRAVCECFVKSGPSFGVKPERTKLLPSLCKLNINIPISPNLNCSK